MELPSPFGSTGCDPQEKFPRKPSNKPFIDQACSVKMAGYWPRSLFSSWWTLTRSRSINAQKSNLANIQTYWPHTWSITHIYIEDLRRRILKRTLEFDNEKTRAKMKNSEVQITKYIFSPRKRHTYTDYREKNIINKTIFWIFKAMCATLPFKSIMFKKVHTLQ